MFRTEQQPQQATDSRSLDSVMTVEPQSESGTDTLTHVVTTTSTTGEYSIV